RPTAANGSGPPPGFFASTSPGGGNFTLAAPSASSSSAAGQARLPRTYVEPSVRPQAWRQEEVGAGLVNGNSAWLRWSRERRASIVRQSQRKARDSITAIRELPPPLNGRPNSDPLVATGDGYGVGIAAPFDTATARAQRQQPMQPAQRGGQRRRGRHQVTETDLTMNQWSRLLAFWQHPVFNRARIVAMLCVGAALVVGVTSVSCRAWSTHRMSDNVTLAASGLWDTCFTANDTCISAFDLPTTQTAMLLTGKSRWPSYWFPRHAVHHFGCNFILIRCKDFYCIRLFMATDIFLGWATSGLQCLAAFCMMLDLLVRESSRPLPCAKFCCCCACCREETDRGIGRPLMA
uniref:G_PROTEIN_RECEP_F1_2 domain-containing protein n=1 Tax=Macrostomum lignano TaxID=282301 RepID=A0A1I8F356_9PLAT